MSLRPAFAPVALSAMLLVMLAGSARAAAVTPISGILNVPAYAAYGPTTDPQLGTDSWVGAPASLSAAATATATYVQAAGVSSATWSSADAGHISFSYDWMVDPARDPHVGGQFSLCGQWCGGPPAWSYSFVANTDGHFRMNYDLTGGDDPWLPLEVALVTFGPGGGVASVGYQGHATGQFQAPLFAGQAYTFVLVTNVYTSGGLAPLTGSLDGEFEWSAAARGAVPEPATWALMIGGFGLVGAAQRRRRRQPLVG